MCLVLKSSVIQYQEHHGNILSILEDALLCKTLFFHKGKYQANLYCV